MSLAGHLAGAAGSSMASAAGRSMGQSIGRPLDGLPVPGSGRTSRSEIDWVDFNYPPFLRLIHFNLEELPVALTGLVRCFHISFQMTVLGCFVNFVFTAILLASIRAPARWLLQSAIHALLLPCAALATFYAGYRGLADQDPQLTGRAKVAQPTLAFVYFLLGFMHWGCANGLLQLAFMKEYSDGSVFWVLVIIIESIIWLSNAALGASNFIRLRRFTASPSLTSG